jgi:hypothetical protein
MTALASLITGGLVLIVVQLALTVSTLLLGAAGAILNWVLSPDFINLPYTKEGIVGVGWVLVRDFTNMFFIVILVFIGLATALRIRDYEAKKTLPLLMLIALLINFTPVICGAVIDASNIVMHFFLEKLTGTNVLEVQLLNQWNMLRGELSGLSILNPLSHLSTVLKSIVLIIFNLIATFIFFAFSFLFIIRYIAIWVLVILSPLAFFSYILPATRKIWSTWWNQFFQWLIIGITAAFFLYLGLQSLTILSNKDIYSTPPPPGTGGEFLETISLNFINEMLPYGIGIAFLLLAFFMGLSTGATGGSQIMAFARTQGTKAGKWIGGATWKGAQQRMRLPEAAERVGRWAATKPVLGAMVGLPLKGYAERYRAGFEEGEKKYTGWKSEDLAASIGRLPDLHKAAALKIIAERGDFGLVERTGHPITDAQRKGILDIARRYGKERDIIKFMPQYAGEVASVRAEAARLGISPEEVVARWQKPADIEKLDRGVFDNPAVRRAMVYQYGPEKWSRLSHQSSEVINSMQETLENEYRNNSDELIRRNYSILRYTHSSAGRGYWRPVGDIDDIDRRRRGEPSPPPSPSPPPPPPPFGGGAGGSVI